MSNDKMSGRIDADKQTEKNMNALIDSRMIKYIGRWRKTIKIGEWNVRKENEQNVIDEKSLSKLDTKKDQLYGKKKNKKKTTSDAKSMVDPEICLRELYE